MELTIRLELEKSQESNQNIMEEASMEDGIENDRDGKECQKLLGVLNEGDHDAETNGNLVEREFGDNRSMDRARKDLINMGLALVICPSEGSNAHKDMEEGVGSIRNEGLILGKENSFTK
ncbi:hypothetical protein J1N35_029463 [Gossypium stocksii]|uniref:Uncharacterized protein n=1 Tax=Gossypium stocksii TaxID=47602 RepID=A0A9D3ZS29_9ROSI|nr:hypothetical protein J1N35_029463 [Gossypium stocksii]